ncbi:MAG: ATP-binding protein [Gemmatimonadaceae bacterium]
MRSAATSIKTPRRILIVDDQKQNIELLKVMLMPEGFDLRTAASGEEALASVSELPPDLILLDVMMPGMNGYEVTAKLKADPETLHIPILMVTALDDRAGRLLGLSAGADDFLAKPVDRAELSVRVRNLLRVKAYADELKAALDALETLNDDLAVALKEAGEARMMAEHANSAKTLFLRAMSHELRTPLNAISGYTEILEMGIRGSVNPEQTKDLGRIKRAAAYLLRLINDVLTIARLEGARPLHTIGLDVNSVLSEVDGLCVLQAKAKGLTLTVIPCAHDASVAADAERFQQILLNLIINAVKFTPSGGAVTVSCEAGSTMVMIQVADTGIGVPAEDIDRVFEPFVQIDRHLTKANQQGVGLGLSISRELARAMHGDLTLKSAAGEGSTFTLTLPVATAALLKPLNAPSPLSLDPSFRAAIAS